MVGGPATSAFSSAWGSFTRSPTGRVSPSGRRNTAAPWSSFDDEVVSVRTVPTCASAGRSS